MPEVAHRARQVHGVDLCSAQFQAVDFHEHSGLWSRRTHDCTLSRLRSRIGAEPTSPRAPTRAKVRLVAQRMKRSAAFTGSATERIHKIDGGSSSRRNDATSTK